MTNEASKKKATKKPKLLSGGNPQIPKGDGDGGPGDACQRVAANLAGAENRKRR
jgi:hypothetical protein